MNEKTWKKWVVAFCLVLSAALTGWAADVAVPQFQAGDRVCMVGDSITHGGRYHSFIYLFYATRFPDRQFEIRNCGISGDSAAGAVRRFDWDIASWKPTVASIMLGMNDVGRHLYGVDKTGEKIEAQRKERIDTYAGNMQKLAELLKGIDCRMIFITPSIYDQTGQSKTENLLGCNDGLGKCAELVKEMARKYQAGVVDFHAPMTALNQKEQQKDPAFTIVGADRVHPGDVGHLFMAYLFLRAQQMPSDVAKMEVDAKTGSVVKQANCKIGAVATTPDGGVSFDCVEGALPFPVPASAATILKLVPFEEEMNQELLCVKNLSEGTYEVLIDDASIATATAVDLAKGVNLAGNPKTPMHKQALEVQKIEDNRGRVAGVLRMLAMWRHSVGGKVKNSDDFEEMKTAILAYLETIKETPYYTYNKNQADSFMVNKPKEAELKAELERLMAEIWKVNKPKPHTFVVRKSLRTP